VSCVRIALVTVIAYLMNKMNFLNDLDEIWYRGLPCNPGAHVFSVVQGGTFKPIDLKGGGGYEVLTMFSKFFIYSLKKVS